MKKDFIVSYISEAIVLCSGILIFKVVVTYFGNDGFSVFALSRRSISFLLPVLVMGLGVGMPRYMAISYSTGNNKKGDSYVIGGTVILLLVLLGFSLCLFLFKDTASYLLFGSVQYANYIVPMMAVFSGLVVYTCAYSFFRGRLAIKAAGIAKAINLGIFPIVACVLATSVAQQMLIQGMSMLCFSAFICIYIMRRLSPDREQLIPCTRELLKYGMQRVPGDFCMAGLLSLPAIATAHFAGVEQAGFIAFGITMLNILCAVFAPVGLILLPKTSVLFARKEFAVINLYIRRIFVSSLFLGCCFFVIIELFTEQLLGLMFTKVSVEMVQVTRVMMVASLAMPAYVSLRSILDAFSERALNSMNTYKTAIIMFLLLSPAFFIKLNTVYIAFVSSMAYIILGLFTFRDVAAVYYAARVPEACPNKS